MRQVLIEDAKRKLPDTTHSFAKFGGVSRNTSHSDDVWYVVPGYMEACQR